MKLLLLIIFGFLAGCATNVLVSHSKADFPNGYATIYTASSVGSDGKDCSSGELSYYKHNNFSDEHIIHGNGYLYFAAPGTFRVAIWCEGVVEKHSGKCLVPIYLDTGGPELSISVEANKSYVISCGGGNPIIQTVEQFKSVHDSKQ